MNQRDYGHYRVYSDANAPDGWGVLCVLVRNPDVGWAVVSHSDYYLLLQDGTVAGTDFAGFVDRVVNDWANVVRVWVGRTVSKGEFDAIFKQALDDRDLACKTGFLPGEQRPDG